MRLAYFSPLNPQPSGISDYSEELLPYLARVAEITLFVDGFTPSNPSIRAGFTCHDYKADPAVLDSLQHFDVIIYHMGNDHRYHAGMLEVARAHPGVVVFHDFALQDFFLGLSQTRELIEIYLEEMLACHGRQATLTAAAALERGSLPPQIERPLEFPLNCRLARNAQGIVVHSEWSRRRFAEIAPSVPVAHIQMPMKRMAEPATRAGNGVVQIANFGLITPGKGIEQALRALAKLKPDHSFHYTLVGEPNSFFDVRALIRQSDMEDRVTITGHVTLEEFEQRIATTDIALNLRERTVGETSASLCRIMAAGVPAIVFNVGAFSELPDNVVVKVEHDANADVLLEAYLKRLIEDANLRQLIGNNARAYMLAEHDIETSARNYLTFLETVVARRPRKEFVKSVAEEIADLGINENNNVLAAVAAEVAALAPAVTMTPEHRVSASGNGHGAMNLSVPPDSTGRMQKLEGIDYKRAALEYPHMLDAERSYYLRTKPFYNLANKPAKHTGYGMDPETHRHFTDFANMAVALALPPGAKILDVGCGSGWLSEYFARLGYDVTGIDISADLVRMAQERLERVPYDLDHETQVRCRFLTHDIELAPLAEKFDAVICYDSLHHLVDEHAVFRHLASMLDIGGVLFILEGHKPESGSATETELCDVMRQFGTLESPFSTSYLRQLFDENGLAVVADHISVNGLFEREMLEGDRLPLTTLAIDYHYFTCMKVAEGARASTVPDSRHPRVLRAVLTVRGPLPQRVARGTTLDLPLTIRNAGDTLWLTARTVRAGIVMPALRIKNSRGEVVSESHGQPMLPRSVPPEKSVTLDLRFVAPNEPGSYEARIDLVDQHVCWFAEQGSTPLVFNFTVE